MNDAESRPEERLADLLVARLKLVPPVDVEAILDERAEIERVYIPVACDAVAIQEDGARARVLVSDALPETRFRFTLAHELGHIVIPWHLGTIVCHTEGSTRLASYEYVETEAEANRFAARLLLPSEWLRGVVAGARDPAEALREIRVANVSDHAACIALAKMLPKRCVLALVDASGHVVVGAASPGTAMSAPRRGETLRAADLSRYAQDKLSIRSGTGTVYFWLYPDVESPLQVSDVRNSKEILRAIATSVASSQVEMLKLEQSVNGIVGSANNLDREASAAVLYPILRQRFAGRPRLQVVVGHSDFELFLSRKAEELGAGR